MQALEIEADVADHVVNFRLPNDWTANKVKIIVLEQSDSRPISDKREFGGLEGKVRIADDFDAELPDSFWLGKES